MRILLAFFVFVISTAAQSSSGQMPSVPFASLGPRPDGTFLLCPDCQPTNPCLGGGTGAFAERLNSSWNCASNSGGGSGTLTSVALTMPSIFSVAGSPITGAGTFAVTAVGVSGGLPYFNSAATLASSASLSQFAVLVGGGAGQAPASLSSLGTTTQVLHGNAGGLPSFGSIVIGDIAAGSLSGTGAKLGTTTGALINGNCVSIDVNGNFVDAGLVCGGGGGGGGVSSVAVAVANGLFTVSGSPIVAAGTITLTPAGTSGGIRYFTSATSEASTPTLTQFALLAGGGAGGAPQALPGLGTSTQLLHGNNAGLATFSQLAIADINASILTGNGAKLATSTGSLTSTHCVSIDANLNFVDAGAACGSGGGGSSAFSAISGGTNTIATMFVGTGAFIGPINSGTVAANSFIGTLAGGNGGTGNAFMQFTGPATSQKTYTLPNASTTILTTSATITVPQGGTGLTGGTSGGFPFFDTNGSLTSTGIMTANAVMKGGGAGVAPIASGVTIDGSNNVTVPGSLTTGGTTSQVIFNAATHFAQLAGFADANGTARWCDDCTSPSTPAAGSGTGAIVIRQNSAWVALGAGSAAAFSAITSGTNSTMAALVGTGASLGVSGSGTIVATSLSGKTFSGNGTKVPLTTGSLTPTDCVSIDANSNFIDAGAPCGTGGGGTGVGRYSGTVTYSSINDGGWAEQTFTATGTTTADTVILGLPSTFPAGLLAEAFVSAANTVKVRVFNHSGALSQPGSVAVKVTLAVYNLSGSGTINFAALNDGQCLANTFALTGTAVGDPIAMKLPSTLEGGLQATMVATATDTVQVRLCNYSGGLLDPASQAFGASIAK